MYVLGFHYLNYIILGCLLFSCSLFCIYLFLRVKHWRIAQRITHANLQNIENKFETLFNSATTGIAILDLNGNILRVNTTLCHLLGFNRKEMSRLNFYYLMHTEGYNQLQTNIQSLIEKKVKSYQIEQRCTRKNGEEIWLGLTLSLINNSEPEYFILQANNISLQKKAEERLRKMAYHDPLTGLANRNKLEQFLHHLLAIANRQQQTFALLFLDLDQFKNINDTIDHEAGDALLKIIAQRLQLTVRSTDLVARLGGDEFVLVITDVKHAESVALIAEKILKTVMKVINLKGREIYISTSIGISLYPHDGQNMQSLMQNADLALYRAKEHGRNNYQFYTLEMTSNAQNKLALQNALASALTKNEFSLHYQPKMNIKDRHIVGVEALLRWQNPIYKEINSSEIIALAEETGLIIPVSEWIIKTATKQLHEWHEMGFKNLTLAINCTARQFKQANFVDDLFRAVNQNGVSLQAIEIEITESTLLNDTENTLYILGSLKELGVKISIDDFGTGYWSLNNLKKLAVDNIKIDKTFIRNIPEDKISIAICKAIIAMTNALHIQTIAEGVETRAQYDFLLAEGCKQIQGYYLTPALPAEQMTQFLQHPIPAAEKINKDKDERTI